jgi:hypothetical protein
VSKDALRAERGRAQDVDHLPEVAKLALQVLKSSRFRCAAVPRTQAE